MLFDVARPASSSTRARSGDSHALPAPALPSRTAAWIDVLSQTPKVARLQPVSGRKVGRAAGERGQSQFPESAPFGLN